MLAEQVEAEIKRARRKPTESLDAYDFFLRGMAREVADLAGGLEQPTSDGTSEALRLFNSAIKLDPEFASAHGMAALCYAQRKAFGWMSACHTLERGAPSWICRSMRSVSSVICYLLVAYLYRME